MDNSKMITPSPLFTYSQFLSMNIYGTLKILMVVMSGGVRLSLHCVSKNNRASYHCQNGCFQPCFVYKRSIKKNPLQTRNTHALKVDRWNKFHHSNTHEEIVGVAICFTHQTSRELPGIARALYNGKMGSPLLTQSSP